MVLHPMVRGDIARVLEGDRDRLALSRLRVGPELGFEVLGPFLAGQRRRP
ncbi:MAG: hypothetical protein R3F30_12635 [Planctomycetota bacterium]